MRTDILGRSEEIKLLTDKYKSSKSELVVVYGRRRVGKSTLIQNFSEQYPNLLFEGLENQTTVGQIEHFASQLKKQVKDSLLQKAQFKKWEDIFDTLTEYFSKQDKKIILFFDEFQWMSAGQSKLVSLIKFYWDMHWKNKKVMLILCGSIASFMVNKVIRSKALYGRFSLELHVKKLSLNESALFFKKSKSRYEILRYILVLGGIPKYLEEIDQRKSFEQNLEYLFFSPNALYLEEFDKIFNVHFKEPRRYLSMVKSLDRETLSLEEISKKLKIKSSGGVKTYLENLELAEFIRPVNSFNSKIAKYSKYKVSDEFLYFYTKFIMPNKRLILAGGGKNLLKNKILKQIDIWMGFAFENYFINNAVYFADKMGFAEKVISFGPYFKKESSVQVDLIYTRSDQTISVCEMKFRSELVSTEVIPEFEAKLKKIPPQRGVSVHKVLIAPNGVNEALVKSEYFDLILTAEDLF